MYVYSNTLLSVCTDCTDGTAGLGVVVQLQGTMMVGYFAFGPEIRALDLLRKQPEITNLR